MSAAYGKICVTLYAFAFMLGAYEPASIASVDTDYSERCTDTSDLRYFRPKTFRN